MNDKLNGKVAIVTGGSRGIGSGIGMELALAGARVALNYASNETEARKAAAEMEAVGCEVRLYRADVASKQQVDAMVKAVAEDFGRVDILVNNAGICPFEDFFDISEETWNRTLQVNLSGMFFVSQAAARHMREQGGGAIVNISTVTSMRGSSKQVHYASSKGGVNALTSSMSYELRKYGIRVNAIICGGVPTEINAAQREEYEKKLQSLPPAPKYEFALEKYGSPADVGKAAVFLASDDCKWVTGAMMAVDGGTMVS